MDDKTGNNQPKKPGTPSESVLRQKVVPYADEIINKLLEHMRSKNPNVSLGAANTLLKKIIPDIKALEVTGKDGDAIRLNIIAGADYFAWRAKVDATSTTGALPTATTVQDAGVAQTGTQDINSNTPITELVTA